MKPTLLKKRGLVARSLALSMFIAVASCRAGDAPQGTTTQAETALETIELRIQAKDGELHRFSTELAITPEAQQRGLSGRTALAPDEAMLFPFPAAKMASFWMKDTQLPLDLLFIRADGTIAEILQGEPMSLQPIAANEPVAAVLEINHGRAAALGISAGDRVEWGNCAGGPTPDQPWQADRLCPNTSQ